MSVPVAERAITFRVGSLKLEGRLAAAAAAEKAVVLCHPHPQYGGDMNNYVVTDLAEHLQRIGVATLRFNFRGTGSSEGTYASGVGEVDDARAAVALLRKECGLEQVTLAGYSFGALVALKAGCDDAGVDRLVAIAAPFPMFDFAFLRTCAKAKLFLLGDRDQYCPYWTLENVAVTLPGWNVLQRLAGADHFLAGTAAQIGQAVEQFLDQAPGADS